MENSLNAIRWLVGLVLSAALMSCMGTDERENWRDAALYAYGPYQYALNVERLRQRNADLGVGLNQIAHNPTLADHTSREVTTPNADTIYSSAILDVSASPVELILPDTQDRYVSIMVMDIFTDVVATVGSHRTGETQRRYWIVGPDWTGDLPPDTGLIRTPGPDAWLLARIFVAGPDDLPAARSVQRSIGLRQVDATERGEFPVSPKEPPSAENMLSTVNILLGRAPDHPHTKRAAAFTDLGLKPRDTEAWDALSLREQQVWNVVFKRVEMGLTAALSDRGLTLGWQRAPENLGQYGDDDATRAAVSLIGFGALRAEEATYFTADSTADGQVLNGTNAYTLTLNPDAIPVEAFWSLSLYAIQADQRRFFLNNPIDRYSINSATPGLLRDAEGRITLHIRATPPNDDKNWMPAPEGPFALVFRAYRPQAPILSSDWTPPEIQPLSTDR